jgi:curved DNA-binding protein CbpA
MAFKNYYEILGIEQGATTEQIREGYRTVSAKYKSATNASDPFMVEMLKNINEAIEVLSNPDKKSEYDKTLTILDSAISFDIPAKSASQPALVNVNTGDAERISELVKKHFDREKALRDKYEAYLGAQSAKPVRYFTSVKVLFCIIVIGIAFYFHSPHKFEFDFADEKKENFTYEFYTTDTTFIYAKPSLKKGKVVKGVSKGTGFNVIEETTYFVKVAYTDDKGYTKEGYVKKDVLEKSTQIPF